MEIERFLREERHPFCPGCWHPIFGKIFLTVLEDLINSGWRKPENVCFISGIGCAALISPQFRHDSMHTTHGRPLAFATGVKLANPELEVIVISGDGDLLDIGFNHLKAAIRRRISIKVFCLDNYCYGMTGGQTSSTTPLLAATRISEANPYEAFNSKDLVLGCGGRYVSLYPAIFIKELEQGIRDMLLYGGQDLCFMDVRSWCPTYYGKFNSDKTMKTIREMYISRVEAEKADPVALEGKVIFGTWRRGESGAIL